MKFAHAKFVLRGCAAAPRAILICALLTLSLALLPAAVSLAQEDATPEDEAAVERAHAERLRRAIEKSEADQAEHARRRDTEYSRQTDVSRLQSRLATLERDESQLHGQLSNTETQLLYMRRDPADMGAHSRRSELESRLSYYRSQLNQITAEKQIALRQLRDLNELRFR
jgi:septal ring factor EnvC (AmiA/AmiB activator)